MNADTSEPHLRNNLVYSDRKDNLQQYSLCCDKLHVSLLFQYHLNSQDIQCVCVWMSDIFSGINKFDLQSSSAKKIKNKVVGVSFSVQYISDENINIKLSSHKQIFYDKTGLV